MAATSPASRKPAALIYTPRLGEYDLGPTHPLKPVRVVLTHQLLDACNILSAPNVSVREPSAADEDAIALVHSPDFIDAVRAPDAHG